MRPFTNYMLTKTTSPTDTTWNHTYCWILSHVVCDTYPRHFQWVRCQATSRATPQWYINFALGSGLVSSVSKLLRGAILNQDLCHHMTLLSTSDLMELLPSYCNRHDRKWWLGKRLLWQIALWMLTIHIFTNYVLFIILGISTWWNIGEFIITSPKSISNTAYHVAQYMWLCDWTLQDCSHYVIWPHVNFKLNCLQSDKPRLILSFTVLLCHEHFEFTFNLTANTNSKAVDHCLYIA